MTPSDVASAGALPQPQAAVVEAQSAEDLARIATLFLEYRQRLGIDLGFQGFDAEVAALPGEYAPPDGILLLARVGEDPAGCAAFRPLRDVDYPNACEMKRLFVRPAFRRFGLGRWLTQDLMDRALKAGYSTMLLDTLDDMEVARGLYQSLGFTEIPPYYFNPLPGAHYLKVDLTDLHWT